MSSREQLLDLVATAPLGITPLTDTALGLYRRFELLHALDVMRAAAEWADDDWHAGTHEGWSVRARAWIIRQRAELLASIDDTHPPA